MGIVRKCLIALSMIILASVASKVHADYLVGTSDQVVVSSEGIFFEIDGDLLALESISMANDGYIVGIPDYSLWYCRNCKKHVAYPLESCPRCGSPNPKDQG